MSDKATKTAKLTNDILAFIQDVGNDEKIRLVSAYTELDGLSREDLQTIIQALRHLTVHQLESEDAQ